MEGWWTGEGGLYNNKNYFFQAIYIGMVMNRFCFCVNKRYLSDYSVTYDNSFELAHKLQ